MALQKTTVLGYGGEGLTDGVLDTAIQQLQGLKVSVLTGAAANTNIPLPNINGPLNDTILSALEFTAGVPSDITSTVSITSLRAQGTLTLSSAVAGGTFTVNGKVFTLVTATVTPSSSLPPKQVAVGATDTVTAANMAAVITAQSNGLLTATSSGAVVTITANTDGTGPNAYTLVGSAHITASGATLAGGSATNGIKSTANTSGNTIVLIWMPSPRFSIATL